MTDFKYIKILTSSEQLRPDKDSKGTRFCMDQFRRAYSTCRIPGVKRDHLNFYFKTGELTLSLLLEDSIQFDTTSFG